MISGLTTKVYEEADVFQSQLSKTEQLLMVKRGKQILLITIIIDHSVPMILICQERLNDRLQHVC